jgi:hypothetical protein
VRNVAALLIVLAGTPLLLQDASVQAWGRAGHQIVAEIAQGRLSKPSRQAVADLLQGATMASVALWADDMPAF